MPTYEYRCPEGHHFELFQRMSDEAHAECPTCGAEAERLLSAGAGFLFRGEGFYITDYRSESYQKAAKADEREGSGEAGPAKAEKKDEAAKPEKGDETGRAKKQSRAGKTGGTAESTSDTAASKSSSGDGATPAKKSE